MYWIWFYLDGAEAGHIVSKEKPAMDEYVVVGGMCLGRVKIIVVDYPASDGINGTFKAYIHLIVDDHTERINERLRENNGTFPG